MNVVICVPNGYFPITNVLTQQMLTITDQVHGLLVHFKSEHFEGELSTLYLCSELDSSRSFLTSRYSFNST